MPLTSIENPIRSVSHFMDERVDTFASVSLQHEINVQRDLEYHTLAGTEAGNHVAKTTAKAITQSQRQRAR